MPNQHTSGWNHETVKRMFELDRNGFNDEQIAKTLTKENNYTFTKESVYWKKYRERDNAHVYLEEPQHTYKEEIEHKSDGSQVSDRLVEMTEKDKKNPNYLLEAHGYDSREWEIVNAKASQWQHHNKKDGTKTLYASKITVKPRENHFDFNRLVEVLENRPPKEPIKYQGTPPEEPTYLQIPLFDLHFGIADLDYYQNTLQDILHLLQKPYTEVLIPIGQDLFHNNDFKGQTANGTKIDQVDMVKATDDAEQFYISIIDEAIKNSQKVTITYSKGNHDEVPSYYFVRGLRHLYRNEPNVHFDIELKERKAYLLGRVFLGITHGDKNRQNLAANFSVEFPELWSKATTRECHIGHLHRKRTTKKNIELTHDKDGLIVRELGTGNKTDNYHDEHGYNLAHKEFEIFEYTETRKKRIHYV